MKENSSTKRKTDSLSRNLLYIFVAIILLAVLMYITYRLSSKVYKHNQINKEIFKLQTEISNLNQENQDLNELINYLQTEEFKEKEAKDKLNLIKEGEQLVLVKEKESELEEIVQAEEAKAEVIVHHENYYWWWHYFFSLQ